MKNIYITYDARYDWGQRTREFICIGVRDAVADNLMSAEPKRRYTEKIELLLQSLEHIAGRKYIPRTAKCVGEQAPELHRAKNEAKLDSKKKVFHFVCDYSVVRLGTSPNKVKRKKKEKRGVPVNINALLPQNYWHDYGLPIEDFQNVIAMLEYLNGNKILPEGVSVGLIDDDVYNEVFG